MLRVCFTADHSGCAVEGMQCLQPHKHWDREFKTPPGAWMSVFLLCLHCPVLGAAL
jgi:hypothetical protein